MSEIAGKLRGILKKQNFLLGIKLLRLSFYKNNLGVLICGIVLLFGHNSVWCDSEKDPFSALGKTVPDYVNKYYDETGRLIAFPDWKENASGKCRNEEKIKNLSDPVVFYKFSYFSIPGFDYCPLTEDLVQKVSVRLSPDEYEPLTFGLFCKEGAGSVKWSVSDFHSKAGRILKKKFIDVRVLRGVPHALVTWNEWIKKTRKKTEQVYKRVPLILEKRNPFVLPANESRHFWLTVYAPSGTAPGIYYGHMSLEAQGWKRELPIEIKVLPIELKTPDVVFNVFLQPDKRAKGFYFKKNLSKHLADIRSHGVNSISCDLAPEFIYNNKGEAMDLNICGISKDNGTSPYDNLAEFLDMYKNAGLNGPLFNAFRVFMGYHQYKPSRKGKPVDIFDKNNIKLMEKFLEQFIGLAKEKNVKVGIEIGDEPANTYAETRKVKTFIPLIRKKFKDLTIITFINGMWKGLNEIEMFSENPPDIYISNFINKELLDSARRHSDDLWIYSNAKEPAKSRYLSGFYSWSIGVNGVATWVYQTDFSYKKSTYINFDGFNGHSFSGSLAAPSEGGPLSMPAWEGYREGIDDQRYICALEGLIKKIKKETGDKALLDMAEKASRILGMIRSECIAAPISSVSAEWLNPLRFQNYRRAIISMILKLQRMSKGAKAVSSPEKNRNFKVAVRNIKQNSASSKRSFRKENNICLPEIDGNISEDAWSQAAVIEGFKTIGGDKSPSEKSKVSFLFSKGCLYVRFECSDAHPEKIVARNDRKRDQEVWKDDCIEFFLLEETGPKLFYGVHFLLNAENIPGDSLINTSKYKFEKTDWDAKWEHAAGIEKNGWRAELKIPLGELGFSDPSPGKLKFLVARHMSRKNENSSFPGVDGQFFEPDKMGFLLFLPKKSLALLENKVRVFAGASQMEVELFNNTDSEFNGTVSSSAGLPAKIKIMPHSAKLVSVTINSLLPGYAELPIRVIDENGKIALSSAVKCSVVSEVKSAEAASNIVFPGDLVDIEVKSAFSDPKNINCRIRISNGDEELLQKTFGFPGKANIELPFSSSFLEKYIIDFSVIKDGKVFYEKSSPLICATE